jgi:hypothetical protein
MNTNISEDIDISIFSAEYHLALKMEVVGSYEMLIPIYQFTQHQIPDDCNLEK